MPRIMGVNIPNEKKVAFSLRYIYGVGPKVASEVLEQTKIDPLKRAKDLDEDELRLITEALSSYSVEGELRREIQLNIRRLMEIKSYRGLRHRKGLPVRGQSSKTNARTRKGPRKGIR